MASSLLAMATMEEGQVATASMILVSAPLLGQDLPWTSCYSQPYLPRPSLPLSYHSLVLVSRNQVP